MRVDGMATTPERRATTTLTFGSGLPSRPAGSVPIVKGGGRNVVPKRPEPRTIALPTDAAGDGSASHSTASTTVGLTCLDDTLTLLKEMKRATYAKRRCEADRTRDFPTTATLSETAAVPPTVGVAGGMKDVKPFQSSIALQMRSLSASMDQVVSSLSRFKPGDMLMKRICKKFQVAGLTSQNTSMVRFYTDRTEYKFKHAKVGDVRMIMYFRDTADVQVDRAKRMLSFHVFNPLASFAQHYNHQDSAHRISITFSSLSELMDVELTAVPLMARSS